MTNSSLPTIRGGWILGIIVALRLTRFCILCSFNIIPSYRRSVALLTAPHFRLSNPPMAIQTRHFRFGYLVLCLSPRGTISYTPDRLRADATFHTSQAATKADTVELKARQGQTRPPSAVSPANSRKTGPRNKYPRRPGLLVKLSFCSPGQGITAMLCCN